MASIGVPLLVIHGDLDRSVPVEQSRNLVAALEAAGQSHTYIEQGGGDHFLSIRSHRIQMLEATERFLATHLAVH